jgi:tryptophanyl-tRNA synthetase
MTVSQIEPLQKRYQEIVSEPGYVDRILREGAERVAPIANATVETVKRRMGLYTAG